MNFSDLIRSLREDYKVFRMVNPGNAILNTLYLPCFRIVFVFRLSQLFYCIKILRPFAFLCTIFNDTIHGVWIGPSVQVGKGFYLGHPRGLIVNPNVIIGEYCSIIQQVTLGGPRTTIGNCVSINAGAKVISNPLSSKEVKIGDNCIIGAGALVLKSMPPSSVVVGMPAVVKSFLKEDENWLTLRKEINSEKK